MMTPRVQSVFKYFSYSNGQNNFVFLWNKEIHEYFHKCQPLTVTARSKKWTVFARSNPTRGMDVCLRLFCVYVVLSVGSGFATDWFQSKEFYWMCIGLRNWKRGQGLKSCRVIEREFSNACYYILSWCSSFQWTFLDNIPVRYVFNIIFLPTRMPPKWFFSKNYNRKKCDNNILM
jgi:hypothetical protein